jgi:NADPH:quinone reductase
MSGGVTAKAVVGETLGPPETYVLKDVELPPPGPGQALVAVQAAGVSYVDVLLAAGLYQVKPPAPFIPGSEYGGVVQAVGEGVMGLKVGDRVTGGGMGGVFSTHALAQAQALIKIPDEMPFDQAAVFRVSYGTVYHALVQRAQIAPGESVLVLGAGGAIGAAAIQMAKALGAGQVIGSASTAGKRRVALEAGADAAVDSKAADWRDQIKTLTEGRGVDIVVDPIGDAATEPAFRSLAWRGRHLVIGFAGGEIPKLPANLPLLKGAALVGVDIRQFGIKEPELSKANSEKIFEIYKTGALKTAIGLRLPLARFEEAMKAAASGQVEGRVVLEMGT